MDVLSWSKRRMNEAESILHGYRGVAIGGCMAQPTISDVEVLLRKKILGSDVFYELYNASAEDVGTRTHRAYLLLRQPRPQSTTQAQ